MIAFSGYFFLFFFYNLIFLLFLFKLSIFRGVAEVQVMAIILLVSRQLTLLCMATKEKNGPPRRPNPFAAAVAWGGPDLRRLVMELM